MHRQLILAAFQKAKENSGYNAPRKLATHLSDFIFENEGEPFGERSLRDYYSASLNDRDKKIELKPYVVKALCSYLGFDSFEAFRRSEEGFNGRKKNNKARFNKASWIAIAGVLVIIAIVVIYQAERQRMMIWVKDHYEEVPLDVKTYSLSDLKLYNEDRIRDFKKVAPDCDFPFFDEKGLAILWYGKNVKGELEYFTALGRHPETGKTLKEITRYMIKNHICETY